MDKLIVGVMIASSVVAATISGNTDLYDQRVDERYEFRCDRIESNYDTGVDYAVIEIFDTSTEEITMIDIPLTR